MYSETVFASVSVSAADPAAGNAQSEKMATKTRLPNIVLAGVAVRSEVISS